MKRVFIGGLMRCCIETLRAHVEQAGSEDEGTVLQCRYCSGAMTVRNDHWQWKPWTEGEVHGSPYASKDIS